MTFEDFLKAVQFDAVIISTMASCTAEIQTLANGHGSYGRINIIVHEEVQKLAAFYEKEGVKVMSMSHDQYQKLSQVATEQGYTVRTGDVFIVATESFPPNLSVLSMQWAGNERVHYQ